MPDKPQFLEGGLFHDHRGTIRYANAFDFSDVKRFYLISNDPKHPFRGWQGHKIERKYFFPVKGKFVIHLIAIDNWEEPDRSLVPEQFQLDAEKPAILSIPPGFANGVEALDEDAQLLIFSVSSIEDAENIKYPQDYWSYK